MSSQGLTLGLLVVILNLDKEKNVIIVNYNEAFWRSINLKVQQKL